MNLFSYIFFRISELYVKTRLETTSPEIPARSIVVLFQTFNIITIYPYLISKAGIIQLLVIVYLVLYTVNSIFFFNLKKLKEYQQRWGNEDKHKRLIKGMFIIIYIIGTIFFYSLAIIKMKHY